MKIPLQSLSGSYASSRCHLYFCSQPQSPVQRFVWVFLQEESFWRKVPISRKVRYENTLTSKLLGEWPARNAVCSQWHEFCQRCCWPNKELQFPPSIRMHRFWKIFGCLILNVVVIFFSIYNDSISIVFLLIFLICPVTINNRKMLRKYKLFGALLKML